MKGYPFHNCGLFARNQWYLAAWASEIGEAPLARRILNQDMVLFRSAGTVVALSGVCPHRWMALARGTVSDGLLSCPYHGARFDHEGRCVGIRGNDRVPSGLRLSRYPIVVVGPCVWVWPGDAERVDISLVPNLDAVGLGGPGWSIDLTPPFQLKARAQLLLENLFDERHVNIIHADTLGGSQPDTFKGADVIDTAERFGVSHRSAPSPADLELCSLFDGLESHVCSDLTIEMFGVSIVNNIGSRTYSTDPLGQTRRAVGAMNFIHAITPETDTTTHYFLAQTRDFAIGNAGLTAMLSDRNAKIVAEDVAILESIEATIDDVGDVRKEVSFASDALAMKVRHRIRTLIEAE